MAIWSCYYSLSMCHATPHSHLLRSTPRPVGNPSGADGHSSPTLAARVMDVFIPVALLTMKSPQHVTTSFGWPHHRLLRS